MKPKLIICGAAGRMGKRIVALAAEDGVLAPHDVGRLLLRIVIPAGAAPNGLALFRLGAEFNVE